MGQGASSSRQNQRLRLPHHPQATHVHEETESAERFGHDQGLFFDDSVREDLHMSRHPTPVAATGAALPRNSEYHSTYLRETHAQSTFISRGIGPEEQARHGRGDVLFEQEERPLILRDMEVRLNDAPITDIQAAPMPRRTSIFSKLSSRMGRRSSSRNRSPGMNSHIERSALGQTSTGLRPQPPETAAPNSRGNRFSMFDFSPLSGRSSRQRSRERPVSVLDPMHQNTLPNAPGLAAPQENTAIPRAYEESSALDPVSEYTRVRNQRHRNSRRSWMAPLSQVLSSPRPPLHRNPSSAQSREQAPEDTANLIAPERTGDSLATGMAADEDSSGFAVAGSAENPAELDSPDRPSSWIPGRRDRAAPMAPTALDRPLSETPAQRNRSTSWMSGPRERSSSWMPSVRERPPSWLSTARDRPLSWMSNSSQSSGEGRRRSRRLSSLFGGRASRPARRDDETPLSRVLQLAAAAIAAQLSGNESSAPDLHNVGDDSFDGDLNTFIRGLNTAAEASASTEAGTATLPPLNFWRVFRFANNNRNNMDDDPDNVFGSQDSEDGASSRLVTLVVVGVRSIPSGAMEPDSAGTTNDLDGLLGLSPTPGDSPSGRSAGEAESPVGPSRRQRPSSMAVNPLPSLEEGEVAEGSTEARPGEAYHGRFARPGTEGSGVPGETLGTFYDEDDLMPEATADEGAFGRSTFPAGTSRDSQLDAGGPTSSIRQRPRNDGHNNLGAGAARRNGVVEPDTITANGRHWLIYVVGTNLSEDHPAFQAPSLFTDNPSYEDMVLLSTLLGPVKPPVASANDIADAQGLYRLETRRAEGQWMATVLDGTSDGDAAASSSSLIEMPREVESCQVCLAEYEAGEEVRELQGCSHVFHRECVETWLTTGRNSCPLCRGQGVQAKEGEKAAEGNPGNTDPRSAPLVAT